MRLSMTHSCAGMSTGTNKVGSLDSRMPDLLTEREHVEKVVSDAEDGTMAQVELFLPCIVSIQPFPAKQLTGDGSVDLLPCDHIPQASDLQARLQDFNHLRPRTLDQYRPILRVNIGNLATLAESLDGALLAIFAWQKVAHWDQNDYSVFAVRSR